MSLLPRRRIEFRLLRDFDVHFPACERVHPSGREILAIPPRPRRAIVADRNRAEHTRDHRGAVPVGGEWPMGVRLTATGHSSAGGTLPDHGPAASYPPNRHYPKDRGTSVLRHVAVFR